MTSSPNDNRPPAGDRYAEPRNTSGASAAGVGHDDDAQRLPRDHDTTAARHEDIRSVEREHEKYGGVKVGSAFFGWLTAVGMFILLSALLSAAGAAIGFAQADPAAEIDADTAQTIGIVSAIVLLLILFVAYYAGGYVAGRMARFDGLKQGAAVWAWAIAIAILLAVIGAVAGSQYDVLAGTGALPRIPVNEGDLTTAGIIAAVIALVVSLAGALLGGKSGERYHRKVDEAGLGYR